MTLRYLLAILAGITLISCQPAAQGNSSRLSGERFQNNKPWGYQIVSSPVRAGQTAQRFEVRPGDCGRTRSGDFSDCDFGSERSEFELRRNIAFPGDVWIGFSVYLPPDFTTGANLFQTKIFQLKFRDGPPKNEQFNSNTFTQFLALQMERDANALTVCLYRFTKTDDGWRDKCDKSRLISAQQMRGRWTDVLINFDSRGTGNLAIYINGTRRASENGFVQFDSNSVYAAYGIYRPRGAISGPIPTQVVYFDEIRIADSRDGAEVAPNAPVD